MMVTIAQLKKKCDSLERRYDNMLRTRYMPPEEEAEYLALLQSSSDKPEENPAEVAIRALQSFANKG